MSLDVAGARRGPDAILAVAVVFYGRKHFSQAYRQASAS